MRFGSTIVTAALLVAVSSPARAQQPPATPPSTAATTPPAPSAAPALGTIDFGFRGFDATGDEARSERYQDLRTGAATQVRFGKATDRYLLTARATNVGYRDQGYLVDYNGGTRKVFFTYDSIPLNYSYLTSSPWIETAPAVFTLDPASRQAVQNRTPGIVGVPSSAAQLLTPSIYRGLATGFDLQQRRGTASAGGSFQLNPDLGVSLSFTSTKKSGAMPWAASFAFNNANGLPLPLDNRTNDFSASAEFVRPKGMIRVGWDGSWFNNNIRELIWDNPLRATDTNPFDPNGYNNGNGPARGRMSMAPDSSMNAVSTTALYKLPARSTINGTFALTNMKQNDTLIPWTINPVIANPAVYASFPGLAELPRPTAEAEVRGINALVNFNTRPTRRFGLTARYRYNNHDNRTPAFDAREYVRFDAVPEDTGGETEQFDIVRNTFDANATFNLMPYTALRAGYGYDSFNRTGRSFSDMTDNTFRVSLDTTRNQYLTFRGIYEHTIRKGSGFSESALEDGGAQPGLRFYDEADRDRDRGTLVVTITPVTMVDLDVSFAGGRDRYKGPGHEFGLLDNDNTSFNAGVTVTPREQVIFGVNYGRDNYSTLQKSRNANPPPDPQFDDPARDWTLDNDETVNNFDLSLDLIKALPKTDLTVAYNYSDSDNGFVFGGPRIASLAAAGSFLPLPDVTNKWRRLSIEAKYYFVQQIGVGVGYWYEKFDVSDFGTIDLPNTRLPRIDYLGIINTGYGNRPYKANTGFVRLLYLF